MLTLPQLDLKSHRLNGDLMAPTLSCSLRLSVVSPLPAYSQRTFVLSGGHMPQIKNPILSISSIVVVVQVFCTGEFIAVSPNVAVATSFMEEVLFVVGKEPPNTKSRARANSVVSRAVYL